MTSTTAPGPPPIEVRCETPVPTPTEAAWRRCVPLQLLLYPIVTLPLAFVGVWTTTARKGASPFDALVLLVMALVHAIADIAFLCARGCLPLEDHSRLVPQWTPSELALAGLIAVSSPATSPARVRFACARPGRRTRRPDARRARASTRRAPTRAPRAAGCFLGSEPFGDERASSLASALWAMDVPAIREMLRLCPGLRPTREENTGRTTGGATSYGAVGPGGRSVYARKLGGEFHVPCAREGGRHDERILKVPDRAFLEALTDVREAFDAQVAASRAREGGA